MYKALIFDLGNVVFNVDFNLIYKHWSKHTGISFDKIKNFIEKTDCFDKFERGDISEDEFRKIARKDLGLNLTDEKFDEGLTALYLEECEGINFILKKLKLHYRIIALSNTNAIHEKVWRVKYNNSMEQFEKIICSHDVNTRKPEKEIYKIALDYLKLKPEEVIFLDDKKENIEPANALGMKTIHVTSPAQMRTELNELLGNLF